MKNSWIIRQAQTSDSSALQTCMQSAYAFYQTRLNGLRLPPMDVDYLEEIQNYPTWVAVNEGQVVGGLILIFTDKCATIANVAVHPENQGQGLGRRLMDFVDSIARE
ncbi:MAG: N-acetylglutamate synthase-like GNAT family acetyltransferase [Parasphingorhabdus sp.]|jgi:N-acetylglutamate synthase-like GNAT family acetyltransferase